MCALPCLRTCSLHSALFQGTDAWRTLLGAEFNETFEFLVNPSDQVCSMTNLFPFREVGGVGFGPKGPKAISLFQLTVIPGPGT